jgi:hypothetical protein
MEGSRSMQDRFRRAPLALTLILGLALAGAVVARAQDNGADQTGYYLGETKTDADGRSEVNSVALVKRVLSPLRGTIEEHILTAAKGAPVNETIYTYRVLGSQVLIETRGSPTKGEGELTGRPWQWNAVRFTIRLPGKEGTVRGERRYNRDGVTGSKTVYDIQGRVRNVFTESFTPVSRDTYEILRAKLLPK